MSLWGAQAPAYTCTQMYISIMIWTKDIWWVTNADGTVV